MVINHYNYWPYTPPRLGDDIRIEVENHIMSSLEVPREILRGDDVVDAVVRAYALYNSSRVKALSNKLRIT